MNIHEYSCPLLDQKLFLIILNKQPMVAWWPADLGFGNSYWDMANWKFWRSILPWPHFLKVIISIQIKHSDIISHCHQSQVCIFNSYCDMANWKLWRSIWPWLHFLKVIINMSNNVQWHHLSLLSITRLYLKQLLRYGKLNFLEVNLTLTWFSQGHHKYVT